MTTAVTMHFDDAIAVTPSDATNDPNLPQCGYFSGFYVGATGGNVTVVTPSGNTTLFAGTIVGKWYPIAFVRVKVTGTAATSIVGLVQAS